MALLSLVPVYLAFTPPKPPPALPPAQARQIDDDVAEKRKDIESIARAADQHRAQPFSLSLREAEINRLLETDDRVRRAMQRENVERAWVKIGEGKIEATAIRTGAPSSLPLTVVPSLDADHRLTLPIEGLNVGRLGVPAVGTLRRAAQSAVRKLAENTLSTNARLDRVEVHEGEIRLSGTTK